MRRVLLAVLVLALRRSAGASSYEGELEVGVEMPAMSGPLGAPMNAMGHRPAIVYDLKNGSSFQRLHFSSLPDQRLLRGQQVRVEAATTMAASALAAPSGPIEVGSIAILAQPIGRTLGAASVSDGIDHRRLIHIIIRFKNDGQGRNIDTTAVLDSDRSTIADFFWESSYHKFQFSPEVHEEDFDIETPLTAPNAAGQRQCDMGAIIGLVAARGYSLNDPSSHLWFDIACGISYASLGNNGHSSNMIFVGLPTHELGHNLGFQHFGQLQCDTPGWPASAENCQQLGYNGGPDPMAREAGDFDAYHKLVAGWLGADQIQPVTADGVFTLNAVSVAGGLHALKLGGSMAAVLAPFWDTYVEYRGNVG